MIKIHQIMLTSEDVERVNKGEEVASFSARRQVLCDQWSLDMGDKAPIIEPALWAQYACAFEVDVEHLEDAFRYANSGRNLPPIYKLNPEAHSASVGDIFEKNGKFYMCAPVGFTKLELSPTNQVNQEVKAYDSDLTV